jgi:hypothetical protein
MLSLEDELLRPGVVERSEVLIQRGFDFIETKGYFSLIHPNAQVPLELKAGGMGGRGF